MGKLTIGIGLTIGSIIGGYLQVALVASVAARKIDARLGKAPTH